MCFALLSQLFTTLLQGPQKIICLKIAYKAIKTLFCKVLVQLSLHNVCASRVAVMFLVISLPQLDALPFPTATPFRLPWPSPPFSPEQVAPAHFEVVPLKTAIRAGPKILLSQTRRGCYGTNNSQLEQLTQRETQANNVSVKWPPGKARNFPSTFRTQTVTQS